MSDFSEQCQIVDAISLLCSSHLDHLLEVYMAERNGHDAWEQDIEHAKDQIQKGLRDLAKATSAAKEQGEEVWHAAQRKAQETLDEAIEKGSIAWEDIKDQGEVVWKDTEKLVRRHPTRALGIALLAGVFLGAFLFSRDRDSR
jgi:ElaB/YqjD/DUF883 family membrane-anchored ribosome-binding protein